MWGAVVAEIAIGLSACGHDWGRTVTSTTRPPPVLQTTSAATSTTGGGPPTGTAPTSSREVATAAPTGLSIAVRITGRKVSPSPATIELAVGESLTVTVTSDHDDQLHAHGFDVVAELVAGKPATVVLRGSATGVFDVETHEPALRLFRVAVR